MKIVCAYCGSEDIERMYNLNPNTKEIIKAAGKLGEERFNYCNNCKENVKLKMT